MYLRTLSKLLAALALASLALAGIPALAASRQLSSNWAGYVAARSGDYSAVGASWTVSKLAATTTLMTDVSWVGIGGSKSKDLIQAGTHSAVQGSHTQYWAWYELLPDYQVVIPLKVAGGDTVEVSLSEVANNLWYISFVNKTTGAQFGKAVEYDSQNSSAEWIEEMPIVFGQDGRQAYAPLSEFGTVPFSNAFATIDGERKTIDSLRASAVTMVSKLNKRIVIAEPSDIAGGAFAVVRSSAVPSPAPAVVAGRRSHAVQSAIVWSK